MNRARILLVCVVAACGGKSPAPPPVPAPAVAPTPPPSPPAEKPMPTPAVTQTAAPQNLAFPDEDFRAHQPAPTAQRPFQLPKIAPFTLPNGIKVYLVEQHALPIVSMSLDFDGGSLTDPQGKDGLASVCMGMLTEGTEKLDKLAYSAALADVASNISSYASDDSQGIGLASLTKHLDTTFALFADTVRTPGLRASDFERMIQRRIEAVRQSKGNPTSIPYRVMGTILYGAKHPLGGVVTEASLQAITLDDCRHQVATWLQPRGARLFVVGDLTEAQIRAMFASSPLGAKSYGAGGKGVPKGVANGAAPKEPALPAPHTMRGRIFFVNVPHAAQSSVMLLQFGPKRTAADYFANTIMSSVLGGGFTSRLNMNLREDKGYSYGARGTFRYTPKKYGTLVVSAPVQADATYQTVLEIDRELKNLWSGKVPVTTDELAREKTNAVLALPGRFATAQAALGQYRSLVYYGLPLDYFNTYIQKVGHVTAAQVKQSAAHHLRPGQAVYLVVGDGDAPMIVDDTKAPKGTAPKDRRIPYVKDGKQLTLREALQDLAKRGDVGAGGFVELDSDGHPIR